MMKDPAAALALPPSSGTADEQDYEALHAALSASTRGRTFLAEYARRNRNADTVAVLAALSRLERLIAAKDTVENPLSGGPSRLAVVPPPDEPELPIPTPTAAQPPLITLAHDNLLPPRRPAQPSTGTATAIPEITWYDAGPTAETNPSLSAPLVEAQGSAQDVPAAEPAPKTDPLAAIMTLTEEERIALFS